MDYCVLPPGARHQHSIEVRRSVFSTLLVRVETEKQARDVIAGQRRLHHEARHHVSAFVLGADRDIRRSSDDGEPSGTAGIPTLEVLVGHRGPADTPLSDVLAVTTRWFGGIKLGASGLLRAYGESASAALSGAPLLRRTMRSLFSTELPLSRAGRDEGILRAAGIAVEGIDYHPDRAEIHLAVESGPDAEQRLSQHLAGLLSRPVQLVGEGISWLDR
ncbi:IMPACT family protein [Acidipropionibacterium virtanenii]|uniref:IMPACT family protein n=1 Tax=Acidipropionibacterium virtanenii TaxID=2057246 RepID=UPI001FE337CC|nr:YigZ family protein [Acidipropionibacterium virtanenii]